MEVSPQEKKDSESLVICVHCGSGEVEQGYDLPLCIDCRTLLARRPFPTWIKFTCVAVLAVLAVAAARSTDSFRAGIAFERAKQAEQRGDFARAADFYGQVAERFPASTEVLARLAVARFRAGQLPEAARILDRLRGRKTSPKLAAEVNQVIQALAARRPPNGEE